MRRNLWKKVTSATLCAAMVSGPGNSGLPLASLNDRNFEMRTRNRHHPLMTFESFSCKNHELMVLLF